MKGLRLNNGMIIPAVGAGTFPYKDVIVDSLPVSLKTGFRLIDTSDNYGNETHVGEGLAGTDLTDIVVVSKFSQPLRTR